ncbi:mobile mystery protein B [Aquirufa antheringensis]|uniref:mobile mystery protein B n=1 Tax=Aquirufa antheringensis TaxID=2516559 RepID=UPI00103294BA|nr:mobile mystery protein B [Aquirufa antheringensis]TBH72679.1 mobile mystery protein B [Aquirufa antheringensis]
MGLMIEYIDGQTPLNEEEKEGLRIPSITTREELDEFEQLNIEKAIQWTFGKKLKAEQVYSEKFIKELHKRMYGEVWKWAGNYRTSEKNIGIKSYLIAIELKQLLDDAIFWHENNTYDPEEMAIKFKHRLVSIHCFANGNGRHSRLMADLIIEKIYDNKFFSWGSANLVKATEARNNYIQAVRKADNNDIQPLIAFAKS